jgi:hypothetical protein
MATKTSDGATDAKQKSSRYARRALREYMKRHAPPRIVLSGVYRKSPRQED